MTGADPRPVPSELGPSDLPPPDQADLGHVRDWVFDLDNTLYPASSRLFDQVRDRMTDWICGRFGLDRDAARAMQRRYFREHGTTLRGLMTVDRIDPEAFLAYVHDIDLGALRPDPRLGEALDRLPGRKLIYTNGTVAHAANILGHLGLASHFDGVIDIVASDYVPKPDEASLRRVLEKFGLDAAATAMVEDIARNLEPAARLGMTTVWVRTPDDPAEAADGAVHHVVDDLAPWLAAVAAALPRGTPGRPGPFG